MGQTSFFDLGRRLEALSAKGDPLETIDDGAVGGTPRRHRGGDGDEARCEKEQRRPQTLRRDPEAQDRGAAEPLQSANEQTEFLIRDRLSFMRFLDLGLEDAVPDATTIWLFHEALVDAPGDRQAV